MKALHSLYCGVNCSRCGRKFRCVFFFFASLLKLQLSFCLLMVELVAVEPKDKGVEGFVKHPSAESCWY